VEFRLPCRRQQERERGQEPPHNAQPGSWKIRTSQRAAQAVLALTVTAGKMRAAETGQGFDFDERCVACQRPGGGEHKFTLRSVSETASL
jgi:hypothetical protein